VLATASVAGLLPSGIQQGPPGLLRVPSAALSVIELAVSGAGTPAVGFFAQVPHYVSAGYPNAAIELLSTPPAREQSGHEVLGGDLFEKF
jgi:hypothetical protein